MRWVAKTPNGIPIKCPTPVPATHPCTWNPLAHPVDVISSSYDICSLRLGGCIGPWYPLPTPIGAAFTELVTSGRKISGQSLGIVMVYSAGNDGSPTLDRSPFARDRRTLGISNCMIDGSDERLTTVADEWPYGRGSTYGQELDICALGHRIPTVHHFQCVTNPGSGCLFMGTSAAAPEVSAAVGLIFSANPSLIWQKIRLVVRDSADKIDCTNGNWVNGRSNKYGSGRLNVHEAVKSALQLPSAPISCP